MEWQMANSEEKRSEKLKLQPFLPNLKLIPTQDLYQSPDEDPALL